MPELLVHDPATGELVGRLPCSDPDGLVATARGAHPAWERTAAGDRSARLKAGARRLRAALDDLAGLQTREGGKPLGDSRAGSRRVGTVKVNAAFGGAPGGAATPHGALGDGFGYGPELLDELTRVRVIHVEVPARR